MLVSVTATGTEKTTYRQSSRVRHQAVNRLQTVYILCEFRYRAKQPNGIRVRCVFENLTHIAMLNDFPSIYDRHMIAILCYHTKIVGNQHNSLVHC